MQMMYTKLYPNWTQYLASNSNNSIVHFGKIQLLLYGFLQTSQLLNSITWQSSTANFTQISYKKNMEIALRNSSTPSSKVCLLLHWFSCKLATTERTSCWISRRSDKL